jgi:hypothetical protein
MSRSGMVVRKNFRIAFALLAKAHRIALFAFFFAFSHFFQLLLSIFHDGCAKKLSKVSVRKIHKICLKSEKNAQNMLKKKCEKCEKVRNANAMRKWNQNSHRIAQL